jgi:hypothetical protein
MLPSSGAAMLSASGPEQRVARLLEDLRPGTHVEPVAAVLRGHVRGEQARILRGPLQPHARLVSRSRAVAAVLHLDRDDGLTNEPCRPFREFGDLGIRRQIDGHRTSRPPPPTSS